MGQSRRWSTALGKQYLFVGERYFVTNVKVLRQFLPYWLSTIMLIGSE